LHQALQLLHATQMAGTVLRLLQQLLPETHVLEICDKTSILKLFISTHPLT